MKYERTNGEMHNIEPTTLTKTVAEMIDDYQMKIYELMKHAYPDMVGYTADCHECQTEDGQFDVHTRFFMHRPEEERKNECE